MKLSLTIILAGFWGYMQPTLFPIETYSILFIFTAILGGGLIAHIINNWDKWSAG